MFLSLLATLAVLGQAPASSEAPLSVLVAPPETPGVPSPIVSFVEEHIAEQLKAQGLSVTSAEELSQELSAAERRSVLGCSRQEASCRITLGEAAQSDVVMIAELMQFLSGYRVALKAYSPRDGELLAEHYVPGVGEDQLLDAFNQALEKVMLQVRRILRPQSVVSVQPPPDKRPSEVTPPKVPSEVRPPPELKKAYRSAAPGWAWVPAAGGVVLGGVSAYFYLQAGKDYTRLDTEAFESLAQAQAVRASGERSQRLSLGAAGLGAAGVVTTGLIYLLAGTVEVEPAIRPTVTLAPTGGMIGVAGTLP